MNLLYIALGGAAGTLMRYLTTGVVAKFYTGTFPYATVAVNVLGSLLIGIIWRLSETYVFHSHVKSFLIIGFVASYTTFSTYILESFHLMKDKAILHTVFYVLSQNLISFIALLAGYFLIGITLFRFAGK